MNLISLKRLALASSLVLPFAATDTLAYGMGYGKSYAKGCGYHAWHHPYSYGMGHRKPRHSYGYGMGHGMPHYGHGLYKGMGYGTGMHGYHPMMKTGGYGYDQPKAGGYDMGQKDKAAVSEMDIVDTAVSAGNFKTLVEAVKAAGLVETLRGDGPFTVFAPTDEAFAKLPAETLDALLQDKEQLTAVLTYHVVPGSLRAVSVANRDSIETVQGQSLTVTADDAGVRVDEATVTKADIVASNGVIHVIDTVILPN